MTMTIIITYMTSQTGVVTRHSVQETDGKPLLQDDMNVIDEIAEKIIHQFVFMSGDHLSQQFTYSPTPIRLLECIVFLDRTNKNLS